MTVRRRFIPWALAVIGGKGPVVFGKEPELMRFQDTQFWILRNDPNNERLQLV